jgi:hypothetical protein
VRVGEIDRQVAAAFGDSRADVDVVMAAPVVVEQRLALVSSVLPLSDHRPGLTFGAVEYRFDRRVDDRPAEFAR